MNDKQKPQIKGTPENQDLTSKLLARMIFGPQNTNNTRVNMHLVVVQSCTVRPKHAQNAKFKQRPKCLTNGSA